MKMRAFVLDDNRQFRELLVYILRDRGYEVYEFPRAYDCPLAGHSKCRCTADSACGDIIITDVRMPRLSGLKFIENQKKKGCRIKLFAAISAYWMDDQLKYAGRLGCKVFNKPIDLPKFYRWLDICEGLVDPHRMLSDAFKSKFD